MSKTTIALIAAFIFSASIVSAADWPQAEVDKAVAFLAKTEEEGVGECVRGVGSSLEYDVKQVDLNGDGINELEITTSSDNKGDGGAGCFGRVGRHVYLLTSDGNGAWKSEFGFDSGEFVYHPRPNGQFSDIEITGPGFCFPIWRHHEGKYGIWKVCDGIVEVFADVVPWTLDIAVPRDSGENFGPIEQPDFGPVKYQAPDFDHNGSRMMMDHRNGTITYAKPKKSIAGSIKPGTVVFKGEPWDQYDTKRGIRGTAYVFKKGCEPAPYAVSGGLYGSWHTLVLKGAAPVRAKNGCAIEGYSMKSPNAVLKFESYMD